MIFSVVLPTCNRPDTLANCLACLAPGTQTLPDRDYEVIVTDDGRSAAAETLVRERFPWARWTRGPQRGPASNRNHGTTLARGEWIVFLDDDCVPEPGWLAAYAALAQRGETQVLEGRTRASGERTSIDTEAPVNDCGGYLWSCNFAIRAARFRQLGGFDEGFPGPAMEDVEFRTRLRQQNVPVVFVPGAVVHHPWRRRKGRAFLRTYVRSLDYFLSRHPAEAAPYRLRGLFPLLAGQVWRTVRDGWRTCSGRGVVRAVGLEIYTFALLARAAVRRRN